MNLKKRLNIITINFILLTFATTAFARAILFQDPAHLAIVYRGDDKVDIGIPDTVRDASNAEVTAFLMGGLIAESIVKHKYNPEAAKSNSVQQKSLDAALMGWSAADVLHSYLLKNMTTLNSNISLATVVPSTENFPATTREFYANGKKDYSKQEAAYDYTSLSLRGITTVMEVSSYSYMTPNGNKKDAPTVFVQARMIDLPTSSVLEKKQITVGGTNKNRDTFEKFIENNGVLAKSSFEALAKDASVNLVAKLKE